MALTEQVILDIQSAERQITALEGQLAQLGAPITVPLNVTGEQELQQVLTQLDAPIDVPVNVTGEQELQRVRQTLGQSEDAVAELNQELRQTDDSLRGVGREANEASDAVLRIGTRGISAFTTLRNSLIGVAATVLAVRGAGAAFEFAEVAIQSASELEQSIGAVDAVFGDLGASVREFGETADQSVGLAASQFNQLASLLGSQLQTFGFSAEAAAAETQKLIVLASDLAATFGGPVSDAVNAISSLLRGEVNPIERYGVAMNETLVQAKGLELGLAATTAELDLQDKTLARLAILMEQTANAQGQFGRESETTAGRLERIRAQFENTRAEIGESLIPAFQALLDLTPALIEIFENGLVPALASVGAAMAGVDSGGFVQGLATLPPAINVIVGTIGDLGGIFTDVFSAIGAGLGGDASAGIDQLAQALDRVNAIGDRFALSKAVQDLVASIQAGQTPLDAFANVLVSVADADLSGAQLAGLTRQLQVVAGLSFENLGDLREFLQTRTPEELEVLGFDEEEIDAIARAITDLRREILGVGDDAVGAGRKGRGFADDLEAIAEAATIAAPEINDFSLQIERLSAQAAREVDFVGLRQAFEALPNELDAAQAALRDEEGQIVDDFGVFLENLKTELEARRVFADNIATLEALGLDTLAEAFRTAGLDAAGALAEAVADPTAAAEAEAALDAAAKRQADAFAIAFGLEVGAFVAQFDPIEMPIFPVLQPLTIPEGTFNVPTTRSGMVFNEINQVFTSPETPTTDRARGVQAINGVITANLQ